MSQYSRRKSLFLLLVAVALVVSAATWIGHKGNTSPPVSRPAVPHTVVVTVTGGIATNTSTWYDRSNRPHPLTNATMSAADLSAVLVVLTADGDGGNPAGCTLTVDGAWRIVGVPNGTPVVTCLWVNPDQS